MNLSIDTESIVRVTDIPNLDAPPVYREIASEGSVSRIILPSGHVAYHLTRYHQVQEALTDDRFIRSPCNEDDGASFLPTTTPKELLLNNDVPNHARLRKVVSKDFSPSGVLVLREKLREVAHARLDVLQQVGQGADLFAYVLDQIPSAVDCQLMGIPLEDRTYYRPLTHTVQVASENDIPELLRQFWLVHDYITDLVTGRRPVHKDGLIQRLIATRHHSEPPLSDKELVGILIGVLIGGDQNILTAMTKVIYSLLAAQSLWYSLVNDPGMIPAAVEELLRLIPLGTTSTFPRVAREDIEGGWGRISRDSVIYADVYAANRDPEVFPDPLAIRFDRRGNKHLQFGYGMHNCMGAALARMEIITVLEVLVARLPRLELAVPPQSLPWIQGTLLRRPSNLPVRWLASN